jgi:hypothetical protein
MAPVSAAVRRSATGAALLVAAALVAACLTGCSSASSSAPTAAQIDAMLSHHGAAVLAHSTSAFLADVDPNRAAADFRSRQAAQIANLARLPLTSWSYRAGSFATDSGALAAARSRLGGPVQIVDVTLTYQLRGVDAQPSVHDLWWTFVTRHGRVYLAGDSDLAPSGGVSWKAPWDFGPIVAQAGQACLVLAHPAQAAQLPMLAASVDAAVAVVAGVLPTGWSRSVAVLVPGTQDEFAAQVQDGQDTALSDIDAETTFDSIGSTDGPTGARIVINPGQLDRLSAIGVRIVLQHEITHVATAGYTALGTARWIVEGLAEYVGNLGNPQSVPAAAPELASALRHGATLPATLPDDSDFSGSSAAQAYQEAWLAFRYLAQRSGQAGAVRFYRLVASSDLPTDQAVAAGLQTVLHESTAAFTAQWRSYVLAALT